MRRLATVRVRTTLGTSIVVGLALLGLGALLSIVIRNTMTEKIDDTLVIRAAELATSIEVIDERRGIPLGDGDDSFTQIIAADGEILAASRSIRDAPVLTSAPAGTFADFPGRLSSAERVRVHVRDGPGDVKIIVATSAEGVDDVVAVVTTSLQLGLPLLLLLVAGSTWVVTGRTLGPVEAIRAEVADIGHADLHKRVPEPRTRDEIGRLADTMNHMLERLEQANERQQRFVSNASHELRTPIATIRHQLEVALTESSPDWPNIAEGILEEDLRMQRMVDNLLWIAKYDQAKKTNTTYKPVDLDAVAASEARRQRAEESHRARPIAVDTTAIHAGQVRGNADDLTRAVRNLVDNAHRHADQRIAIAVTSLDSAVELLVDDDGPGVDSADQERIFERFTRADEARSRDDGGVGLGLAIARDIATAHGGTLEVTESAPLGGARFSLTLPSSGLPPSHWVKRDDRGADRPARR